MFDVKEFVEGLKEDGVDIHSVGFAAEVAIYTISSSAQLFSHS